TAPVDESKWKPCAAPVISTARREPAQFGVACALQERSLTCAGQGRVSGDRVALNGNREPSMRERSVLRFFTAVLVAVATSRTAAQVTQPGPPVRQVDHVMIRTGDPKELFEFFVDV